MERNSEEKSDKYRVNLGVWQPKFGRSFAIWQFGRTFGFPKDENSAFLACNAELVSSFLRGIMGLSNRPYLEVPMPP